MKLAEDSYYGTSLLWASFFGSSQPCSWLTGKILAQQTLNTNSSHNFSANLTKLSSPSSGCPQKYVIRWFCASVNAYHGTYSVSFLYISPLNVQGISLRNSGIHALLIEIKMTSSHDLSESFQ